MLPATARHFNYQILFTPAQSIAFPGLSLWVGRKTMTDSQSNSYQASARDIRTNVAN